VRIVMAVLVGVAVMLDAVAVSDAATVYGADPDYMVEVEDSRGERNRLVVSAGPGRVVVRERGSAPLRAEGVCRPVGDREVRCPVYAQELSVAAGAGDDHVVVSGSRHAFVEIAGGRGDDRVAAGLSHGLLSGGRGNDILRGGPRRNSLYGGGGADRLSGGAGNDRLSGDRHNTFVGLRSRRHGVPGDDLLAGGAGRDTASWWGSRTPVRVDLARQSAASRRDADRLMSIESAVGGRRDDRLLGDDGPNRLWGGRGGDTLIGRGGNDWLEVTARTPEYLGGSDGARDRLVCGPGDDVVSNAARTDVSGPHTPEALDRHCERLAVAEWWHDRKLRVQPLRSAGGRVHIEVFCADIYAACRRRVTLFAGGVRIGRTRLVRVRPEITSLAVRLRRPLPATGVLVVRIDGPRYALLYRLRT
jgi:hypothetical protein